MTALSSPATARNKDLILDVLSAELPGPAEVLEIASGAGEHAVHMARHLPHLVWQPTDPDAAALTSIAAWRDAEDLPNLKAPVRLDAADPDGWPVQAADAIVCINMVHISPWAATEGLFRGAGERLAPGGLLYLYGPYLEDDVATAASNLTFDDSLKSRNPAWGIRRREDVEALAAGCGLTLTRRIAMPANNLSLCFRRS